MAEMKVSRTRAEDVEPTQARSWLEGGAADAANLGRGWWRALFTVGLNDYQQSNLSVLRIF